MTLSVKVVQLAYLLAAAWLVCGDVYMHNPRGSNNRLKESSANRRNANRLFDSQNNNRGGYNAGDSLVDSGFSNEGEQYYMKYFQSGTREGEDSLIQIEWTNQHGCGGNEDNDPHKLNCNIVLQYFMPQTYTETQTVADNVVKFTRLRNGNDQNTQTYNNVPNNREAETQSSFQTRRNNNVRFDRGLQETFEYYDDCTVRNRNRGLFTADQRLRGNTAKYTRQNPNGNRRGYECPEERDYYPYWHPTPWRDIAILTDNMALCDYYQRESFNVQPRHRCRQTFDGSSTFRHWSPHNNQADCEGDTGNQGTWVAEYGYIDIATSETTESACMAFSSTLTRGYTAVWSVPTFTDTQQQCLILPPPPECIQAPWSRVNHLGNGRDGVPLNYTWKLPHFLSSVQKLSIVRIRYNISTDDYDPWQTDASSNEMDITGRRSPVEQNPNVNIGNSNNKPLRLAINTAQFGRTFQDRSHVMHLRSRDLLESECSVVHNLNVRGKRGNIVQVYPAVEYDFIPNRFEINNTDCVHIQWTGSNTHNNRAPGGDGQTGDAGEGRGGTDRHNIIQIPDPNSNYPCLTDKSCTADSLFKDAEVVWASFNTEPTVNKMNLELAFASGGYYECLEPVSGCTTSSVRDKAKMDQLLNNVSPSFEGAVLKFKAGTYYYICSRNNNFTNRSQKGMLEVNKVSAKK